MDRKRLVFEQLYGFIKVGDHTSVTFILKWYYQKQKLFELKNDDGLTLVHSACLEGQLKCLGELLRNGASIHTKSSVGWRALHAATLGGHKDVVSYLLKECSADPLEKDDMGCLASDLTMDKSILQLLNTYVEDAIVKKEIEALAYHMERLEKRRTFSCEEKERKGKPAVRANSMFCNQVEATQIRVQQARSKSNISNIVQDKMFLQIPSVTITTDVDKKHDSILRSTQPHNQVIPSSSRNSDQTLATERLKTDYSRHREEHNQMVMREKLSSSSSTDFSLSPTSPKAVRFFSLDRNRRKRETKNRDSGVFDDDNEIDAGETVERKQPYSTDSYYKLI